MRKHQQTDVLKLNIISEEPEEILQEESEEDVSTKAFIKKKSKSRPDMAIRRKQLKAKSKIISDQIKKRKQALKKKKSKKN